MPRLEETERERSVREIVERLAQLQDLSTRAVAASLIELLHKGLISPSYGTADEMVSELQRYLPPKAA